MLKVEEEGRKGMAESARDPKAHVLDITSAVSEEERGEEGDAFCTSSPFGMLARV